MFRKPELAGRTVTRRELVTPEVSEEQIRQRAYEIYVGRGGEPGHELDDWLQAEDELRSRARAHAGSN